ncbi:MAG: M1 family metallopeptidase [Deltaproteobacteria bacterium]|nr:M1 family metallopeptidase [Deltaproteobacteria bacterium]
MARTDPHSHADDAQPTVTSFHWKAQVDFTRHVLECHVALQLSRPGEGPLDLDTRDLQLHAVEDASGQPLQRELGPPDKVLGQRLRVQLPAGTTGVVVRYATSPSASALQWLEPGQTHGKQHPFLFSQCQALHARSVVPLQDSPAVRVTYTAELEVPAALRAVMAARADGREEHGGHATERFTMPQPIPPYLLALAVGELSARELGPRTRAWAEPGVVEKAAWEFADVDRMLTEAEALFGPYDWERFDLLTLPPSFPYGGMENPRLTFLTPTLLAGDRSLVNVVAHELAHSWTGNLVTNATAEHFWLNEGWTVWAERRILERLSGREASELHAALGRRSLEQAVAHFREQPALTRLRTHLSGVDPDEAFSQVPYEKGYLLLRALEQHVGRPRFEAFARAYMARFRFGALTTEDFCAFCEAELPGALAAVKAEDYLDAPGIPVHAPRAHSERLSALLGLGTRPPSAEQAGTWGPTEWQLYLELLPRPLPEAALAALEPLLPARLSHNPEVRVSWVALCLASSHGAALAEGEALVSRVGRMKYLKPLYAALLGNERYVHTARAWFERFKGGYHPIAQQVVEGMLKKAAV